MRVQQAYVQSYITTLVNMTLGEPNILLSSQELDFPITFTIFN